MQKQNGSGKFWFVVILSVVIVVGFGFVVSAFNAAGNASTPSAIVNTNVQPAASQPVPQENGTTTTTTQQPPLFAPATILN